MADEIPFWRSKMLREMTDAEWESLCDGCGKCCLHKLEDEDTGDYFYTNVACRLLDVNSCQCSNYAQRKTEVPDCVRLTAYKIPKYRWLPETCAYRLLDEGKDLPGWHPLVSGSRDSVHLAGESVREFAINEYVGCDLEDHLID